MYNPEAPFGLESFDLEALDRLTAERLMAEAMQMHLSTRAG